MAFLTSKFLSKTYTATAKVQFNLSVIITTERFPEASIKYSYKNKSFLAPPLATSTTIPSPITKHVLQSLTQTSRKSKLRHFQNAAAILCYSTVLAGLQCEVIVVFPKSISDYQGSHSGTMLDVVFLARFSSIKNQNGLGQKGVER